jgi:hypothetical protein
MVTSGISSENAFWGTQTHAIASASEINTPFFIFALLYPILGKPPPPESNPASPIQKGWGKTGVSKLANWNARDSMKTGSPLGSKASTNSKPETNPTVKNRLPG